MEIEDPNMELVLAEIMTGKLQYGGDKLFTEKRIARKGEIIEVPRGWALARGTSVRILPPPDKNLSIEDQLKKTIADNDRLKLENDRLVKEKEADKIRFDDLDALHFRLKNDYADLDRLHEAGKKKGNQYTKKPTL